MIYKNCSRIVKTFYGVTFQPGDIKEVPGTISDKSFVRVSTMPKKEPPASVGGARKPGPKPGAKPKHDDIAPAEVEKEEQVTPIETTNKEETANGTDSNQ